MIEKPTIYLYPVESLHVTVATLRAFSPISKSTDDILSIIHLWKDIIQSASMRSDWPKEKIVLELEHAQIGSTTGILLWREGTRTLQAMRNCLRREVNYYKEVFDTFISSNTDTYASSRHNVLRESLNAFSIPEIVHTSFLRFVAQPITDGRIVQRRFSKLLSGTEFSTEIDDQNIHERVANKSTSTLHQIFEKSIEIATVRLVAEYYPYRLFPGDENQVIWDYILTA